MAAPHLECSLALKPASALSQEVSLSAGDDKKVAVWEAWTWKERAQAKPFAKGAPDSLASSPRAGAATGPEPGMLAVSGERAAVWGL